MLVRSISGFLQPQLGHAAPNKLQHKWFQCAPISKVNSLRIRGKDGCKPKKANKELTFLIFIHTILQKHFSVQCIDGIAHMVKVVFYFIFFLTRVYHKLPWDRPSTAYYCASAGSPTQAGFQITRESTCVQVCLFKTDITCTIRLKLKLCIKMYFKIIK